MELRKQDNMAIDGMVERWMTIKDQELEATFGLTGLDATSFMAISQRLQDRGHKPVEDLDRLSIFIKGKDPRISLQTFEVLSKYCTSNTINNIEAKDNVSILKKLHGDEKDTLVLSEYNMKIKSRREVTIERSDPDLTEIFALWQRQPKAFRLLKRWSFMLDGMRIDMSIVRSSPMTKASGKPEFEYRTEFLAPYSNGLTILQQPLRYEVEVELIHGTPYTDTKEKAKASLIRGIGEVLRALQGNSLLIRKSIKEKVLIDYKALLIASGQLPKVEESKPAGFRGPQPITLEVKNMETVVEEKAAESSKPQPKKIANIRTGYNVTDKADGLRCMGFVNEAGDFYLIDMSMRVYRTGLKNTACANSLVDGEWIQRGKDLEDYESDLKPFINQFGIFDIFTRDKKNVSTFPFVTFTTDDKGIHLDETEETRYGNMKLWMEAWMDKDHFVAPDKKSGASLIVTLKTFEFANPGDPMDIFRKCASVLDAPRIYNTDGLILTPNDKGLPSDGTFLEQFKWKPAEDNTVDFLVTIEPKIHWTTDSDSARYKELILYVNSSRDPIYDNPRKTVLYMLPLPKETERDMAKKVKRPVYQPSQFIPTDFPDSMASRCYLDVVVHPITGEKYVVTETGEPIANKSIVEMRYDPTKLPGRRWIPMRIRHDKTERYTQAVKEGKGDLRKTLNSENTANSIWRSIHNPVTVDMIRTGSEIPEEAKEGAPGSSRYYNRQASSEDLSIVTGLRNFHNRYIKQQVLYGSVLTAGMTVLDLACGQAGDIHNWVTKKAAVVVGVDIAIEGLRDKKNGAYARYMNFMIENGRENVPKMVFLHGDSSKSLKDGSAVSPDEPLERDMMLAIMGTAEPKGKLPPFVNKGPEAGGVKGALIKGANVASCMFALHYFFKDSATLEGFLQNLQENVQVDGYFIACFTDGEKVFNMLKEKKDGIEVGIEKKVLLWSIQKKYDVPEFPEDEGSLGLPIDVKFISLGEEVHTEYLVSYPYLLKRLEAHGFSLLDKDELATMGLQNSTNTFDTSYKMVPKKEKERYAMSRVVQQYSFTNRWLIVKRRGVIPEEVGTEESMPEESGVDETSTSIGRTDGATLATKTADALGSAAATVEPETQEGGKSHSSDYKPDLIFLFGPEVSLTPNLLEREDKFYPRCLSPIWHFLIKEEGKDIEYPSLEHFWAAMKVLYTGKGPKASLKALASSFSCDGAIHREAKERLTKEVKEKNLISTQNQARMKIALEELDKLRKALDTITYDDTKSYDKYIKYGLEQRWKHDVEFHKTVEELRLKNAYLLYSIGPHLGDPTGLLAGKVRRDKTIEGDNLIGKTIMELAKFKV